MYHPKSAFILVFFSFMISVNLVAAELIIITGKSSHSPEDRVPPVSKYELKTKAKKNALRELNPQKSYRRVSDWKVDLDCNEVYEGSSDCYKGSSTARASFVEIIDFDRDWEVRVSSGGVHWHKWDQSEGEVKKSLYKKALDLADFFCGNRNANIQPYLVESETKSGVMEAGCMFTAYSGTFKCE